MAMIALPQAYGSAAEAEHDREVLVEFAQVVDDVLAERNGERVYPPAEECFRVSPQGELFVIEYYDPSL